jgi:hypothetical protein
MNTLALAGPEWRAAKQPFQFNRYEENPTSGYPAMDVFVEGFVLGRFRDRPLMEALTDLDAAGAIDTASRAIVTAKRFADASKTTALPDKLAGIIFRRRDGQQYYGYAITAKDRQLRCRKLGGFRSDGDAKQAIADEYGKRDGHPLFK